MLKILRSTVVDIPGLEDQIKKAINDDPRTTTAIAADIGVTRQHIYEITKGAMTLPEETLLKIEQTLGVEFDREGIPSDE